MGALITVFNTRATINAYRWYCQDPQLERFLNSFLDPFGPSPSDPNPDLTQARKVTSLFNGRVVKFSKTHVPKGDKA